ncbi:MAG: hypothetical protein K2N72_02845 [Oscillospiraceae bacterium]|nr:hypothetical protein [Oscillospiraceae bacterium]
MKKTTTWERTGKQTVIVILLLVFGGVIAWNSYILFAVPEGYFGIWVWNSNAKLTYTNTATCLTKYEESGGSPSDMDGIYWGSLQKEKGKDYEVPIAVDGTRESFDHAMKTLMGNENAEVAGCYYVVIKGGIPVQAFWSNSNELLYYAERYAERFGQGEIEGDFYIGGKLMGRYPEAIIYYPVKSPPEWLQLTFSDRMRTSINYLRENGVYYIIFIAPLLIYLIIESLIKFVKKHKKETPALENI